MMQDRERTSSWSFPLAIAYGILIYGRMQDERRMAENLSLDLIGKVVVETRDAVRKLAGLPDAVRQLQDDQTVMIRMLQAREAEIELMRSLERHYAGLRARMLEVEQRLAKLEVGK